MESEDGCSADCLDEDYCPPGGFCPKEDTTLSGVNVFSTVLIPEGVTVTCTGEEALVLNVTGPVVIEGALRADGPTGTSSDLSNLNGTPPMVCGGYAGGDGLRNCVSDATIYCDNSPEALEECSSAIGSNEMLVGHACHYLSSADGMPGFGPGAGLGGAIARPTYQSVPIVPGGGGGAGHVTAGTSGGDGPPGNCGTPQGGASGSLVTVGAEVVGGSGGGGGGIGRTGNISCPSNGGQCVPGYQCFSCGSSCTGWGGDGGYGGGVIRITSDDIIEVSGEISARGGDGGDGEGVFGGGGGGGSGGGIRLTATSVILPDGESNHLDASGGLGGLCRKASQTEFCNGEGVGGDGGDGHILIESLQ